MITCLNNVCSFLEESRTLQVTQQKFTLPAVIFVSYVCKEVVSHFKHSTQDLLLVKILTLPPPSFQPISHSFSATNRKEERFELDVMTTRCYLMACLSRLMIGVEDGKWEALFAGF